MITTRSNFTAIPNCIDDMDLSVYAYRLYGRIKRRAGDDGLCWESTDNLASACKMSAGAVSNAKQELVNAGLIEIKVETNPRGGKPYHVISIVDVWDREPHPTSHDEVTSSPHEQASSLDEVASSPHEQASSLDEVASSPHEQASSPGEPIKIPIINIPNTYISSANADDIQAGQPDELTDLFQTSWKKKRLNQAQKEAIESLRDYPIETIRDFIKWALTNDLAFGRALSAAPNTLKNWNRRSRPRKGGNGAAILDPGTQVMPTYNNATTEDTYKILFGEQ